MNLLDPTFISLNCDYSFGDQSGAQVGISQLKDANISNRNFLEKVESLKRERNWMTLFIDNIRLYNRVGIKYTSSELTNLESKKFKDQVVSYLFERNDLLKMCSKIDMNFIIFTGFEDTPIDEEISERIPKNVINIFASNSIFSNEVVIPIPYGIKRKLSPHDNTHNILLQKIESSLSPTNLAYCNFGITNIERINVKDYFSNKNWVTNSSSKDFSSYLDEIKRHKFVICPDGNAIGCDCHRDWETLYMRRVPIVKKSEYLQKIFKNFPVLFVDSFLDVTEELLKQNEDLYQQALKLDFNLLDYSLIYKNCIDYSLKKLT